MAPTVGTELYAESASIVSHFPPPLKAGGGAACTASSTAARFASTFVGHESSKSAAGIVPSGAW